MLKSATSKIKNDMSHKEEITLKITTFLSILATIIAAVMAHYQGLSMAREYTDEKIRESKMEILKKVELFEAHSRDLAVIKEIVARLEKKIDKNNGK